MTKYYKRQEEDGEYTYLSYGYDPGFSDGYIELAQEQYASEVAELQRLPILRDKRRTLLSAFDILKSNVIWGIDIVTNEEKQVIDDWYRSLLDLEPNAFENVPVKVSKYL